MAKKKSVVQRIIELGYGFPSQKGGVMWFRVGAAPREGSPDWETMLGVISEIQYNEFDGAYVASMLGFRAADGQLSLVEFGREYSPVLYLHFDSAKQPELATGKEHAVKVFLKDIRIEFGIVPDEVSWDTSRMCLRLWWD
jgi:hypothetical protein